MHHAPLYSCAACITIIRHPPILNTIRNMKRATSFLLGWYLLALCCQCAAQAKGDQAAFDKLRKDLTMAFATGDTATIRAYHHPDVVKALSYHKFINGRDSIMHDMTGTFSVYSLHFTDHRVENFVISGDLATEISAFTIKGTPKGNGQPFTMTGRSMVVYKRYAGSPAGWAIYREMIQTGDH